VDEAAMVSSLDAGHAQAYVSDFPTTATMRHPKCVTMPHLGASTAEAEDNCAVMVADQVRDFLDHGHVRNSVNFPELIVPRQTPHRSLFACVASDQAAARISDALALAGVPVAGLATATRNALMYLVADTGVPVPSGALERLAALEGVCMVRAI
jgi:D-3-phosphoglycerate dehydrogenase